MELWSRHRNRSRRSRPPNTPECPPQGELCDAMFRKNSRQLPQKVVFIYCTRHPEAISTSAWPTPGAKGKPQPWRSGGMWRPPGTPACDGGGSALCLPWGHQSNGQGYEWSPWSHATAAVTQPPKPHRPGGPPRDARGRPPFSKEQLGPAGAQGPQATSQGCVSNQPLLRRSLKGAGPWEAVPRVHEWVEQRSSVSDRSRGAWCWPSTGAQCTPGLGRGQEGPPGDFPLGFPGWQLEILGRCGSQAQEVGCRGRRIRPPNRRGTAWQHRGVLRCHAGLRWVHWWEPTSGESTELRQTARVVHPVHTQ